MEVTLGAQEELHYRVKSVYANRLKKRITINTDGSTTGDFKSLAEAIDIPY